MKTDDAAIRPIIGVTADVHADTEGRLWLRVRTEYADAIFRAGGSPVALLAPPSDDPVEAHARACARTIDGVVFTGGADLDTARLSGAARATLHPRAVAMHARRQAFDLALYRAMDADDARHKPVLGICLGMQEMAVHRGARLEQHIHDTLGEAGGESHRHDQHHIVRPEPGHPVLTAPALVASSHHQAVTNLPATSAVRAVARAPDGVIEAIDDPSRPFYLGVQWHPERTNPDPAAGDTLSDALFRRLVEHARTALRRA